jgi:hypothetical protein
VLAGCGAPVRSSTGAGLGLLVAQALANNTTDNSSNKRRIQLQQCMSIPVLTTMPRLPWRYKKTS